MTALQLFVDGTALRLGDRIGKGGEGEVYAVADDPSRAIKFYTVHDGAAREPKIAAIVRMRLADRSSLVAFPAAIARDRAGRFMGFVMRLVRDHKPLHELYSPGARKQNFPDASYRFLVRSALNAAKAIASVHDAGCVIGDINHSGILISNKATAALIDADSFQIVDAGAKYLCRVGVPEYTPPELQGQSLASVVRTPNHDAFGLAIVLFQLLAMGRHPFVGSYAKGDMPIERAISEFRFAYSLQRSVGMTTPPGACTLKDFPPSLAEAFEAAFSKEGSRHRPTAKQWMALLEDAEKRLVQCRSNGLHHHFDTAGECPWCRMEKRLGIMLFIPKLADIAIPPQADLTGPWLSQLWPQIEAIRLPPRHQIRPILTTLNATPSQEALQAAKSAFKPNLIRAAGIIVGIGLFVAIPAAWWIAIGIAWAAFSLARKHQGDAIAKFKQQLSETDTDLQSALDAWTQRLSLDRIDRLRASLNDLRRAIEQLKPEEDARIAAYKGDRHSHQLRQHLDRFRIRDYKIHGVGPAKLATLASYGVETAGDFTQGSILTVPGFGPINSQPLVDWQAGLARSFVYNAQPTSADQIEIGKIRAETAKRAQELRDQFSKSAREYLHVAQSCRHQISSPNPQLDALHQRRCQIEADCRHLGISIPPAPMFKPLPPSAPLRPTVRTGGQPTIRTTQTQPPRQHTPSCPICSSAMIRRTARRGSRTRRSFWGCSRFPSCRGTRPI